MEDEPHRLGTHHDDVVALPSLSSSASAKLQRVCGSEELGRADRWTSARRGSRVSLSSWQSGRRGSRVSADSGCEIQAIRASAERAILELNGGRRDSFSRRNSTSSEVRQVIDHYGALDVYRQHLAFVDSKAFQSLVGAVILANMWALALETDHPEWHGWLVVNGLFLAAYIAEFTLCLFHKGLGALCTGSMREWMLYDLVVVTLGVLDFLAACSGLTTVPAHWRSVDGAEDAVEARDAPPATAGFLLGRCLMFTRLLRIVRIVRMHAPLYKCVQLLRQMLRTFAWILSIIFFQCFALAIVLTSLIGHGFLARAEDGTVSEEVQAMFSDIPTSLFTLFQLTTADDWSRIAMPMVACHPLYRLFFMLFIALMSWTMLSFLTAVASETMMSASSNEKEKVRIEQDILRHRFTSFLCSEFVRADADGNNALDKTEFMSLMKQQPMRQAIKDHGIHVLDKDLARFFDTLDIDESGLLSIQELVTGFIYLQENLAMKHVANVGYSLKRFSVRMSTSQDQHDHLLGSLASHQEEVLNKVLAKTQLSQELWSQFVNAQPWDSGTDPSDDHNGDRLGPKTVRNAYRTLSRKLTRSTSSLKS